MNKLAILSGLLFLHFGTNLKGEAEDLQSAVARFYSILLQAAPPNEKDEAAFFATDTPFTQFIRGRTSAPSDTVIWDYIRRNKGRFITAGADEAKFRALISTSFSYSSMKSGKVQNTVENENIIVTFPSTKSTRGGYSGSSWVVFRKGEKSYIDAADILFSENGKSLFEIAVEELGVEPKEALLK